MTDKEKELQAEAIGYYREQIAELKKENTRLRNENLDIINKYTRFAETDRKTIADLEAEVKEWKDKADLWCKTANLKDHNIMINKELEKENAELKEKYAKNITDCDICDTYCNSQLTKAKELLKKLYEETRGYMNDQGFDMNVINEVYDFIKSEVEK